MKYYQTMKLNHVGNEFRYVCLPSITTHPFASVFFNIVPYLYTYIYNKNIYDINHIIYIRFVYIRIYVYKTTKKKKK